MSEEWQPEPFSRRPQPLGHVPEAGNLKQNGNDTEKKTDLYAG